MGAELEDQVSLGTEAATLRPECKGAREPGCTGKGCNPRAAQRAASEERRQDGAGGREGNTARRPFLRGRLCVLHFSFVKVNSVCNKNFLPLRRLNGFLCLEGAGEWGSLGEKYKVRKLESQV